MKKIQPCEEDKTSIATDAFMAPEGNPETYNKAKPNIARTPDMRIC